MLTSPRERKLWIAVALIVAGIYSTLAISLELARSLRGSGIEVVFFVAGMALVIAMIAAHGLRLRGREWALGLGALATALLLVTRLNFLDPAERTHLLEYSVLAVFLHAALVERQRHGRGPRRPALVAAIGAIAIGLLDEGLQAILPQRVFDPMDLLFNTLAASGAMLATISLRWLRARRATRSG